ncbi:MAG: hypothetical protein JWP88_1276 [Flaviaesturariibacter sp.]|nr:hypothetical protein [Flaviaesturariibacter sp.]
MSRKSTTNAAQTDSSMPQSLAQSHLQDMADSLFSDKYKVLGLLYANMQDYFLLVDHNLRIQLFNQFTHRHVRNLLGIELSVGTSVLDLAPPERQSQLAKLYKAVLSGERRESETTLNVVDATYYIHNLFTPARDESGTIIGVIVYSTDITEKKKKELELQEKEERWRFALEGSNMGLWDWNLQTGEMYFSDSYRRLYGFEDGELENKTEEWTSRIHPADKETVLNAVITHTGSSNPNYETSYRLQDKAGEYRWILSKGKLFSWDEQGKPLRMIGTHTDITQQKEAEEALKKSNERFQLAAQATSEGLWEWDIENDKVYTSPVYKDLFGFDIDPGKNYDEWHVLIHPDDREETIKGYYDAISNPSKDRWDAQYRYLRSDGSYVHVSDHCLILRNADGKAIKAVGALQDITKRKKAEEEAIISNERFKYATKATSDAIYDWDLVRDNLYWGEGMYKLFGHQPADVTIAVWETLLHPDEYEKVIASLNVTLQSDRKRYWKQEYRLRRADGNFSDVLERGFIIRNAEGKAVRMIGAVQDITDQKEKERQLLESNERFDIVMQATNDLIWDWDLETGSFYRDKEGIRKVYGVADEASIATSHQWLQRVHPDDHPQLEAAINEIRNHPEQRMFEAEYRFKKDDGEYAYIYDRGILVRNSEGRPVRLIGAAQNVTIRKQLEQELLLKELNKQKIISQSTIETQERERGEIGKELHDNVNQILTTTKLYLDLSMSNTELKDELIQKSSRNIIYVINEIRQLSRSLMNPSLGDLGLLDSISDLIENINLTKKLQVKLIAEETIEAIVSDNQKLMIYRITQEALNNAIRHARAASAIVQLSEKDGYIILKITDDGIGFDPAYIKKGAGLNNIQNRVYLANGTIVVQSEPQRGCTILITFPTKTLTD